MLLLMMGGTVLVFDQGRAGGVQLSGLLAVLLATMAWGVDNTLSRALAERDPGQVVLVKAALGATATAVLARVFGDPAAWVAGRAGAPGRRGDGLWIELALLPSGATRVRGGPHRVGVRLCAFHRCGAGDPWAIAQEPG